MASKFTNNGLINLQLVSPYRKCPYGCKYCVSAFDGNYPYEDLYLTDRHEYLHRLGVLLNNREYSTITITGMTEPTLFEDWIEDVLFEIYTTPKNRPSITIQTHNYKYTNKNIDVIAYSSDVAEGLPKYAGTSVVRYTFLLTDKLDMQEVFQLKRQNPQIQMTIKYLQLTSNHHKQVDDYIRSVRRGLSPAEQWECQSLGIWIDANCMDTDGRYEVFRSDGCRYRNWEKDSKITI